MIVTGGRERDLKIHSRGEEGGVLGTKSPADSLLKRIKVVRNVVGFWEVLLSAREEAFRHDLCSGM